jgi:hypothetical protein
MISKITFILIQVFLNFSGLFSFEILGKIILLLIKIRKIRLYINWLLFLNIFLFHYIPLLSNEAFNFSPVAFPPEAFKRVKIIWSNLDFN